MATPPSDFDWLAELCWREHPSILGLCIKRLRNEADALDACQETYQRANVQRDKLRTYEHPERWLTETAKYVCQESRRRLDRDRRRWRRADGSGGDQAPVDALGAQRWRRAEAAAAIVPVGEAYERHQEHRRADDRDRRQKLLVAAELVELLPTTLREVAVQSLQGLTHKEIANALGLKEGTVATRLHRARIELARRAEERRKGGDDDG